MMSQWHIPNFDKSIAADDYSIRRCSKKDRWGVRVIILLEDGIVLVQHSKPDEVPFYVLPGGKIEIGETVIEAGIREVKEETGLDVTILRPLYVRKIPGSPVEFYLLAQYISGEMVLGTDPELDHKQVLSGILTIAPEALAASMDTFLMVPRIVQQRLAEDLKWESAEEIYLGATV